AAGPPRDLVMVTSQQIDDPGSYRPQPPQSDFHRTQPNTPSYAVQAVAALTSAWFAPRPAAAGSPSLATSRIDEIGSWPATAACAAGAGEPWSRRHAASMSGGNHRGCR